VVVFIGIQAVLIFKNQGFGWYFCRNIYKNVTTSTKCIQSGCLTGVLGQLLNLILANKAINISTGSY